MFPAAAMEDQEKIMEGSQPISYISTPPFSSPDPGTDALKMEIVDSEQDALTAKVEGAEVAKGKAEGTNYNSLSPEELDNLVKERDLTVKGTGANGNVLKKDKVAALQADDTSDLKAADFKKRVDDATTQEELDEAAQFYTDSGKDYASVKAAVEKKQEEINEADQGDNS
jgi:hypothetical protein